jgi:hypothetical protein
MGIQCGQTTTPTTDETPLPCDEFTADRCTIHENAISYLSLGVNTPLDEVLEAYLLSLIDARNRIDVLEGMPTKTINDITTPLYQLEEDDAENTVTVNSLLAATIVIPDEVILDYNIGTEITLINLGVGVVTVAVTGGAAIVGTILGVALLQGEARTLVKVGTDSWLIKY